MSVCKVLNKLFVFEEKSYLVYLELNFGIEVKWSVWFFVIVYILLWDKISFEWMKKNLLFKVFFLFGVSEKVS